jgi:hypothetical protein
MGPPHRILRCHKRTKRAKKEITAATASSSDGEKALGWEQESSVGTLIDAFRESVYSHIVPINRVQVGQVWKKDDSGDTFLITKIYSEALTTFAVLRKTGSEEEPPIRIKISKSGASAILPGFSYTQESDEF